MNKGRDKFGLISILKRGILVLLVSLIVLAALLLIYINIKKNDISKELLLLVNKEIKGDFSVQSISLGSLFSYPELKVSIENLNFHAPNNLPTHGEIVLSVPSVVLQADISDVFSKEIIIETLHIENAQLYIERDSLATSIIAEAFQPNKRLEASSDSTSISINIKELNIENSEVIIKDDPTKVLMPFSIDQAKGNLKLADDIIYGNLIININPLRFKEVEGLVINNIPIRFITDYKVDLVKEKVVIDSEKLDLAGEIYALNYDYDFTHKPSMHLLFHSTDVGVDLDSLLVKEVDSVKNDESIGLKGVGHVESKVSWNPDSEGPFLEEIEASFMLEGRDLKIDGIDLDDMIDKFKRSQNFNLVDIGAVMFTGPAGLAVTKGGDFARLAFIKAGDSTHVKHFVAQWTLEKGLLKTEDVALSTGDNLIATDGWYQVQTDSLDFNFSVLDKRGCELVGQRIYGDALQPDYQKVKLLKTVLGPVKNFFRNIGMAKCDTIYSGQVKHPEILASDKD